MRGKLLVIVESDAIFARNLARAFERRGYEAVHVDGLDNLQKLLKTRSPRYAIVDLKLKGPSGLACIEALHAHNSRLAVVVLTAFASIATAVEAVKLGATNYLTKPSGVDMIEAAFEARAGDKSAPISTRQTSIKTVEWEHIHRMLIECDFNISEAARRLSMHRRTLARKLAKKRLK